MDEKPASDARHRCDLLIARTLRGLVAHPGAQTRAGAHATVILVALLTSRNSVRRIAVIGNGAGISR
jgi:hypothetical protein